jgi:hypothetical protein
MNVKNDISEELRLLSAVVAAISRQTPYVVPEGYFLTLPVQVLQQVSGRHVRGGHLRGEVDHKSLVFNVPEGYFDGFAQQVLNKIKSGAAAADALGVAAGARELGVAAGARELGVAAGARELGVAAGAGGQEQGGDDPYSSILAEAGRRTPYSVPSGYFEANAPLLCVARANNPYSVPAEYFEGQVPLLAIARNNPYAVPAGYFDEQATAGRVAAAMKDAVEAGGAKVIGIGVRRMNWLKYAAAAVVAGFIVTVGLLRIHTARDRQIVPIDIAKTMSTVSDQELQNFLTVQGASFEQPISSAATLGVNDNDLKTLLGNVPDGELKQYMEEHGGADDIATN